jgi:hypothetical protein
VSVPIACQQNTPCTWQQVLAAFPNAGVRNTPTSAVLFKAGGPWAGGFDGNVDAFNISINAAKTVYDFEPLPHLSVDDVTHAEGNTATTAYTFTVTLSRAFNQTVTVDYSTADDTATAPSDYTAVPATQLTFNPGETTKQFTVSVNGDTAFEPDEQFFVNLSNPSNATLLDSQGTGIITNDDAPRPAPNTVYVDDDWAAVPNGTDPDGPGPATEMGFDAFSTVQGGVTGVASGGTVNVHSGTYTEQVTVGKSLTLAGAGQATTTIVAPATLAAGIGGNLVIVQVDSAAVVNASGITVAGPRQFSGCSAQTFYGIFVVGGASLDLSASTVRDIRMSDPAAFGCQDGIAVRAGSQGLGQTATLTLTGDIITGYQKSAVIIDGTGTTGTVTNSTITGTGTPANIAANAIQISRNAAAGVTGTTITGNLCNNAACGPDPFTQAFSTGVLIFSTPNLVTLSNNTITNNDAGIYNNGANTTISGNTFTANRYYGVFLDEGSASINDDTITGASNVGVAAVSFVGNGGNSTGTLTHNTITGATTGLQMLDDTSGSDAFVPQLTAHFNRIVATTTAIDNPQSATADLENNWWGCNAGPGNTGCGAVTGTGADFNPWFVLSASATPNVIVPGGTSTVAADMTHNSDGAVPSGALPDLPAAFSASNGTMSPTTATVHNGAASSTFTSTNADDATANVTVDNQNVPVPITVNAPSFSVDDVTHNEGNSGTTVYTFTVTKTGATNLASSVDFTTQDGTATVAGNDYVANSGTLNFAANETIKQFTVSVNGDTAFESDETFAVHLSNAVNAEIADADGTGTITNDDPAFSFSVNDVSQLEGNAGTTSFTFTVTKTGTAAQPSSVDFATSDGTATVAGNDYVANSGTLNFAAGDTSQQFTVTVNGDTTAELDEQFFVSLSNPSNATVADGTGTGTIRNDDESVAAGQLIISEFRLRGPGADATTAANNEFVELYNSTGSPLLVTTTDGSAGWAIAASDGVVRFSVPNGTIIPARGHFLGVNTTGYSLSGYPSGNDGATPTNATGDPILLGNGTPAAGYTLDIPDNVGLALFRTANPTNFSTGTRLDAAGSTAESNTLYKEGAGYTALAPADIAANLEHSFYRSMCSFVAAVGCTTPGVPKDAGDNATDFLFVDTSGTPTAAGQRLGAPSPENLSGTIQRNASLGFNLLDRTMSVSVAPNRVRDFASDPANNSQFGTLSIRRRVTNSTAGPVTRLRFRIVEITTYPNPSGFADLRARTSGSVSVSNVGDTDTCGGTTPCSVTVQGTTLEQPPNQTSGGGYNSSLAAGTITLGSPLQPNQSINLQFLMGIQQTGTFRFLINIEALP